MSNINNDLKELLSFHEMLSVLCFNINLAKRYDTFTINQLSDILKISEEKVEKVIRVFRRIGLVRIFKDNLNRLIVEMTDTNDFTIKNTIFEVIWENKREYSAIYQQLILHTIQQNHKNN